MASLKDTIITGSLRVTDTTYTNDLVVSASKTAKYVLAAPNAAAGAPTWRALSNSDVGLGNVTNNAQVKAISSTDNVVPRFDGTAGQIQTSRLTISDEGYFYRTSSNRYPGDVQLQNSSNNKVAEYWYDTGNDTNVTTDARFRWWQASPNSTANASTTGKGEYYSLPKVAAGLSANKEYDIITTKNLSSITTVGTITSGTWNGSAISASYIGNHSTDKLTSGILGVTRGGTGKDSWTQWGVLYASASTTLTNTAAGTAGYLLQGNGAAAPSWIQATNSNTASTIVKRDASGNFSAGTITASLTGNVTGNCSGSSGSCTGNAATVSRATFGDASNGEHNCNNITSNGLWYYTSNGPSGLGNYTDDAALYSQAYSSSWVGQIAQDYRTGSLFVRSKNNNNWQSWKAIPNGIHYVMTNKNMTYDAATEKFTKIAGGNDWNAEVKSTIGYKECKLIFHAGQTNSAIMFGLNSDPSTNATWTSLDYCWYLCNNGSLEIRESNSSTISPGTGHTTYAAGDEFVIEYSYGTVRYYHNGVLCRRVTRAYGTLLYLDSSFHGANGYIYNVHFEPLHEPNEFLGQDTRMDYGWNGVNYFNLSEKNKSAAKVNDTPYSSATWTHILRFNHANNAGYYTDLAIPFNGNGIYYKRTANGTLQNSTTNGGWVGVIDALNIGSQSVNYATSAGKATNDSDGNAINSTYFKLTETRAATTSSTFAITNTTASTSTSTGALKVSGGVGVAGNIYANQVHNAVWNDYAEYRECDELAPGMCVQENDDGKLTASNRRLIPACSIITDTFGFSEGETDDAKTPVAVAGRVLAYTYLPRRMYHAGMAVCSAPGGTIDIMTREEIRDYPDCIIGYVSEIPDYEEWGTGNVKVNGRIWIKVK